MASLPDFVSRVRHMSFFPGNDPDSRRRFRLRRHRADGHPQRQGHRRLRGAARAADRQAPAGRPVHLLRPHGSGDPARRPGARRAPASAYRARHRHLSVRRQDQASRFARHRNGDRAGRREPDDGRPRHRPFRAHARGTARRADVDFRACRPGWRCPTARRRSRRCSRTPPARRFPDSRTTASRAAS